MVTKDELRHLGWLSRIELSDTELETYATQVEQVIQYLDTLDALKLDGADASAGISGTIQYSDLRTDKNEEFGRCPLGTKYRKDGYVVGPRMA